MANGTESLGCFCVDVLVMKIGVDNAKVQVWDVVLLAPAALFLFFLLFTLPHAFRRLKSDPSSIFKTFYVLVWISTGFSALRCLVAMGVTEQHAAVKILWVLLHFILFITALTVVALGLAFGSTAPSVSIRRSLLISVPVSAAWSIAQAVLEFRLQPAVESASMIGNQTQSSRSDESDAYFLYGGVPFMLAETSFFVMVYCVPFVLVCTSRLHGLKIPARKSFYVYCLIIGLCHTGQCIGLALILSYKAVKNARCSEEGVGYCIMDLTSFIYYSLLVPVIYYVFLHSYFKKPVQPLSDLDDKLYKDIASLTENSPLIRPEKRSQSLLVSSQQRGLGIDAAVAENSFGAAAGSVNCETEDLLGSLSSLGSRTEDEKLEVKLSSSLADLD